MAIRGDSLPPPRLPIRKYATPVLSEGFFTERVDITAPDYVPLKRGTKYTSLPGHRQDVVSAFTELYFLRETRTQDDYPWAIQLWATDTKAEDSYNSAVEYIANSVNYPSFSRTYTVRRDAYEADPTIAIASTLTGLVGVKVTDQGSGYTQATGTVGSATVDFVIDPAGHVIAGIVQESGSGITPSASITIIGDGTGATATAIVQPTTAVLTSQKKTELPEDDPLHHEYVLVTRVYETLPGPFLSSTKIDEDGTVITTRKRRNVATSIISGETLGAGVWANTTQNEIDDYVAEEVIETRSIPGNPVTSTELDKDGLTITTVKTMKDRLAITTGEQITAGTSTLWVRTHIEPVVRFQTIHICDKVAWEVVESRPLPGNPIPEQSIDERDGKVQAVVRTMVDGSSITASESISGGIYTKIASQPISDRVSWKIETSRPVPGNPVVKTVIDASGDKMTDTRTLVELSTIATTNVIVGGVWTKTFQDPITDILAWKVEQVRSTQNALNSYEVEIPDLIPEEFRSQLPTTTHEQTVIGTAALPTLATGDLMRRQVQLDAYTYRLTVRGRSALVLPITITNKELTSEFGGGILDKSLTLEYTGTGAVVSGLYVVSSKVTQLGNGTEILEIAQRHNVPVSDPAWPVLVGSHVDERYAIRINFAKQVVAGGTLGGSSPDGTAIYEVKPHDKWKSIEIVSQLDPDSLPDDTVTYGGQRHSFPPELLDAVIDWAEAICGCSESFSAVLVANFRQYSGPVNTRITEQFYKGPPPNDIVVYKANPESHNFGFAWGSTCGTGDGDCRTKSGAPAFHIPACLHGDLSLTIGIHEWDFDATKPAALPYNEYIMLPPHVERWRFGVFRRVLTEVLVPDFTST